MRIYADEGISGTKIKKRAEFLRMMADAERGLFELVLVKDISRFARNTVDLLESVRKLKALGIETQFLTAYMTSMGNSEFVLTVFGALAQEESANTSKRVKFGKKMNAEKGRVPNLVYGYDKTKGDYFNLRINEAEAEVVRQIFRWYVDEGYGTNKIAAFLNERGLRTKRDSECNQTSVSDGQAVTARPVSALFVLLSAPASYTLSSRCTYTALEVPYMRDDLETRARELAVYLIERRTTIRDAAKHFSVSKSTVHKDLSERLREIDRSLYVQVKEILEQNKAERHLRGGDATKRKYQKQREK